MRTLNLVGVEAWGRESTWPLRHIRRYRLSPAQGGTRPGLRVRTLVFETCNALERQPQCQQEPAREMQLSLGPYTHRCHPSRAASKDCGKGFQPRRVSFSHGTSSHSKPQGWGGA